MNLSNFFVIFCFETLHDISVQRIDTKKIKRNTILKT
jgi:hypothetical protein